MCGRNVKTVLTDIAPAFHAAAKTKIQVHRCSGGEGLNPQTSDAETVSRKKKGAFVSYKASLLQT